MKSLKNALCIFLAAVMAFSVIGLSAFAADPVLPADASYVSGDADGNAIVNSADALTIMNHTVGNAKMTDIVRITAADVSNDNVVNSSDALYILNFKVGNIKEFNRKSLNLTKVAGNIMLDPYTGCVVDAAGVGLVGYGYDRNAKVFYATGEGWQREFGYSEMYDVAAVIASMPLDTTRIKFTYGGKDWMVQLWKGFYGFVFAGCEVGIYNRPHSEEEATAYNVVPLEYYQDFDVKFYYNDTKTPKFQRATRTWWFTAFTPAFQILPEQNIPNMIVDCTMTFNDIGLMNAFVEGLENVDHIVANYTSDNKKNRTFSFSKGQNYTVDGNKVWFQWQ